MDQWGNNASQPALQKPGAYSGQQWTLTPNNQTDTRRWQMQSNFAGPLDFLASFGSGLDSLAMTSNAPTDDTFFEFVPIGSSTGNPTSPSPIPAAAISTTSWVPTASPTAIPASPALQKDESGGPHLVGGAIAGIAIGASVGVILLAAAGLLFWRKRKQRSRRSMGRTPTMSEMGVGSDDMAGIASPGMSDHTSLMTPATEVSMPTRQATVSSQKSDMAERIHELPARIPFREV